MSTKHHQPAEVADGVYRCEKCGELGHKALDQMAVCGSNSDRCINIGRYVDIVDDGTTPEGHKQFKERPHSRTTTISIGTQRIVLSEAQQGKKGSGGVLDQLADILVLAGWGTKK